jgi:hypothetical protein
METPRASRVAGEQARPNDSGGQALGADRSSRFALLESAVRAGQASSAALVRELGTADPWRLAQVLHLRVELRERCRDNLWLRSEVLDCPPTIILYTEALADLSRLLVMHAPRLVGVPLDTIAVAIEVFRYLERARPDLLHGVSREWPRVAREVAAHAFAQDLLETPFFPAEIDAVDRLARAPGPQAGLRAGSLSPGETGNSRSSP